MYPLTRRAREIVVIGLLIAVPILTYATHAGRDSIPGVVRSGIVWATSSVQGVGRSVVSGLGEVWSTYIALGHVARDNAELRRQLEVRVAIEHRLAELARENDRLRLLAGFLESAPQLRLLGAEVSAYGVDTKFRSIRINVGERHGVAVGMPVVVPAGLVGRIHRVFDRASDVLLITDPSSAVAVLDQRTRARATARGIGELDRLRLDYVLRSDPLDEGDALVTAPSGGLFPRGLRVGYARNVGEGPQGLFKDAELATAVDFDSLEEVLVVLGADTGWLLPSPLELPASPPGPR